MTSLIYADGLLVDFIYAAAGMLAIGALLVALTRRHKRELRSRDGFLLVTLALDASCRRSRTVPLMLALPGLSFTDAFFETMSGLTTTGATVLTGLDAMAPSLNLWRHALHWFGGMGIIVLVVAILPLLGVGGMQLYKAETPGPVKDEKLTPRIDADRQGAVVRLLPDHGRLHRLPAARRHELVRRQSAMRSRLWRSAGSRHTTPALDISTRPDRSRADRVHGDRGHELRAAFHRLAAEEPAHVRDRSRGEGHAVVLIGIATIGVALYIWVDGVYPSFWTALRHVAFNLVSIATDCGSRDPGLRAWPVFAPMSMLMLVVLLRNTGSTGGGIKMFRTLVLFRQASRELWLLVHPAAVTPVKIRGQVVANQIVFAVLAFVVLYFATVVTLTFVLLASGLDFVSSFSRDHRLHQQRGPGPRAWSGPRATTRA